MLFGRQILQSISACQINSLKHKRNLNRGKRITSTKLIVGPGDIEGMFVNVSHKLRNQSCSILVLLGEKNHRQTIKTLMAPNPKTIE